MFLTKIFRFIFSLVRSALRGVFNHFLQGLLFIVPLGLSLIIVFMFFEWVTDFTGKLLTFFGLDIPELVTVLGINIPGLKAVIIIVLILLIALIGMVGQTVLVAPLKLMFNRLIRRTPFLQPIYSIISDFLDAFVGKKRKFKNPVLVTINASAHVEKIGFITQSDLSELSITDKVGVFCPHSYNVSGDFFIVPVANVRPLDIPASEAMKLAFTGGITQIPEEEEDAEALKETPKSGVSKVLILKSGGSKPKGKTTGRK